MLIDLPPVYDLFSLADCHDLFLPRTDDRLDDDAFRIDEPVPGHLKNEFAGTPPPLDRGVFSNAGPFQYTSSSSSDSDADNCFSDIDMPAARRLDRKMRVDTQSRSQSQTQTTMSSSSSSCVKQPEQELALHSPGQLLGTPRDPKRRYEYPFPAHLRGVGGNNVELDISEDAASSTTTTPGPTPAEGCLPSSSSSSLGLMALASPMAGISNCISATGLPRYLQASGPSAIATQAPVPAPVPVPIPVSMNGSKRTENTFVALAPLAQALPVAGSSPPPATSPVPVAFTSPTIAAHPKLSRFNPADAPVPPGLRERTRARTRKSASVSDNHGGDGAARPRQTGVSEHEEPMLPGSVSVPTALASRASAVDTTRTARS